LSSGQSRAAVAALDAARPSIARLDRSPNSEDLAADLVEAWSAVEGVLRALLGGTTAAGTALLREARQRDLLTFEQANSLAAFHAARARVEVPGYRPTDGDLNAARDAFVKLEAALRAPPSEAPPAARPQESRPQDLTPLGMRNSPLAGPTIVPPPEPSRRSWLLWSAAIVLLLVAGAAGTYWYGGRRDRAMSNAIDLYARGQHDAARAEFTRALRLDPSYALPHVYLARMARENGNLPQANEELQAALGAEPGNELALREMGAYLLTVGNYELARKFYLRALEVNPEDHTAQGFLGCTLIKLGRIDEGTRWIARAGKGAWSDCSAKERRQ